MHWAPSGAARLTNYSLNVRHPNCRVAAPRRSTQAGSAGPGGARRGADKDVDNKQVPDEKFRDGYALACLMGEKAIEMLTENGS